MCILWIEKKKKIPKEKMVQFHFENFALNNKQPVT